LKTKYFNFLLVLTIIAYSCNKTPSSTATVANVYVSGNNGSQAVYWKNGAASSMTGFSKINSVIISGGDVYLLGQTGYWKNSVYNPLPNAFGTYSFFVAGTDVYVAGYTTTSLSTATAAVVYWKNSTLVNLTQNIANVTAGWASSIFVSGSDVYVAGNIGVNFKSQVGVYWKNGNIVYLSDCYLPKSIAVSGNDVYVAGTSLNNGDVYWKNGSEQILGGIAIVNSMTVNNNDVYIAGYTAYGPNKAAYWKNGTITSFSDGWEATGITINGQDVYVCGNNNNNNAIYWKNGMVDTLGVGSATGISVGN
jgi:hypothetical protein